MNCRVRQWDSQREERSTDLFGCSVQTENVDAIGVEGSLPVVGLWQAPNLKASSAGNRQSLSDTESFLL